MKRVAIAASMIALFAIAWTSGCSDEATVNAPGSDAGLEAALPRPSSNDPQVLAGWQAVLNRGCATCHQSPDASDGILSGAIAPQPGTMEWANNLTPDPDTGLDAWDASAIANAMRIGFDDEGAQLCPTMPRFPDMKDDEAIAIAAYLQSLAAVHHYVPGSVCPPIKLPDEDAGQDDDAGSEDAGIVDAPSDG